MLDTPPAPIVEDERRLQDFYKQGCEALLGLLRPGHEDQSQRLLAVEVLLLAVRVALRIVGSRPLVASAYLAACAVLAAASEQSQKASDVLLGGEGKGLEALVALAQFAAITAVQGPRSADDWLQAADAALRALDGLLKAASESLAIPEGAVTKAVEALRSASVALAAAAPAGEEASWRDCAERANALAVSLEKCHGGAARLSRQAKLILAAGKRDAAAVQVLLSAPQVAADPLDVNGTDPETGDTALHRAVGSADMAQADVAVVAALLAAGASVVAENRAGMTPLHVAARKDAAREGLVSAPTRRKRPLFLNPNTSVLAQCYRPPAQ